VTIGPNRHIQEVATTLLGRFSSREYVQWYSLRFGQSGERLRIDLTKFRLVYSNPLALTTMQYVVKSERGQHHKRSALIVVVETRVPMMAACEVDNVKHSIDRLDHDVPDMAWARKAEVLREAFHVVSKDSLGPEQLVGMPLRCRFVILRRRDDRSDVMNGIA
jgi:hypothetical protein